MHKTAHSPKKRDGTPPAGALTLLNNQKYITACPYIWSDSRHLFRDEDYWDKKYPF